MKKILIIDDDPDLVKLIDYHIRSIDNMSFTIITANEGLDGLKKARVEKPDLILLDLMLPKLDGYKICRLLKFDDRYKEIPIIMITAKSDKKDEMLGKKVGTDAFITKPFDKEELENLIKKLIE